MDCDLFVVCIKTNDAKKTKDLEDEFDLGNLDNIWLLKRIKAKIFVHERK